jgi:tetratricopeptide (TPR) repeat protein
MRENAFELACRLVSEGRYDEAAAEFAEFARVPVEGFARLGELSSPSPADDLRLLGRIRRFLRLHPRCAWGWVFLAFARRSLFRYAGCSAAMARAARLEPRSAPLRALKARMSFAHRFPEAGLRDLDEAVRLAPCSGWIRCWRGEARRQRGRPELALADLDAGAALDPEYAPGRLWKAAALFEMGRFDEALQEADAAIALDPRPAWSHHLRMALRLRLGRGAEALLDANEAHRRSVKYGWVYGRGPEAGFDALERARRLADAGGGPWARAWLGWTLLRLGRAAEAAGPLHKALAAGAWPKAWLAEALLRSGRPEEAASLAERACREDPGYPLAPLALGEALWALGRPAEALKSFDEAVRLDALSAPALAARARARAALGRLSSARADVRRALDILPGHPEAARLRRALYGRPKPLPAPGSFELSLVRKALSEAAAGRLGAAETTATALRRRDPAAAWPIFFRAACRAAPLRAA